MKMEMLIIVNGGGVKPLYNKIFSSLTKGGELC